MKLFNWLKYKFNSGQKRSILIKANVVISIINKGVSFIVSFLLVRFTINYVDSEQYGIWLTITSLSYWISLFDFGLTNGMRNKLAESLSNDNYLLAKKYISTTYILLAIIFSFVAIILLIINKFVSWSSFLKLEENIDCTLNYVFIIVIICFCLSMIVRTIHTVFIADQRPALSAIMGTVESASVLIIIIILTNTTKEGSLINLAYANSATKIIIMILISIFTFLFIPRYIKIKPGLKFIDLKLSKNILGLGGKFLIIQLSMLLIYQVINFIIIRNLGAEEVTLYNVLYKYYGAVNTAFVVFLTPFWSASTDAYIKGDINWIKKSINKLNLIFLCLTGIQIILIIISPWLLKVWLNVDIIVPRSTNVLMAIYLLVLSYSSLYMYFINGIGKITLQMIIYIIYACLSIPIMIIGTKIYGLNALIIVIIILNLILILLGKIQIEKLLSFSAKGIWNN